MYQRAGRLDSNRATAGGLGEHRAGERNAHLAVGAHHIDPVIRVAGVAADLLILLVPVIHPVPVEGDPTAQRDGAEAIGSG
jgi:hypothetical protein